MILMLPYGATMPDALLAPPGTRMPFHQASPPVGWVQDTTTPYNDTMIRTNNSGPSTGGTTGWSGFMFGNTLNLNAFTLSASQLPVHNHAIASDPGHSHAILAGNDGAKAVWYNNGSGPNGPGSAGAAVAGQTVNFGPNDAGLSAANNGSGAAIQPSWTTPQVKFLNMIIGIKQ